MLHSDLILQNLIERYKPRTNHYVYRLSFAGKFIIVKGKTLSGSLYFIQLGYTWFRKEVEKEDMLYLHFYRHLKRHQGTNSRFRVKVLLSSKDDYDLLKTEQQALDAYRFDKRCLNNTTEAYIPKYNEEAEMYGWLSKGAVLNWKNYLQSEGRKALLKKDSK